MYRDDVCAVCGESLPPDHFYCREHGANVDARLHALGAGLDALTEELSRLAALAGGIAQETWDYLAEDDPSDPLWPPAPTLDLRVLSDEVEVDVDTEPGFVRVTLRAGIGALLGALAAALDGPAIRAAAAAARDAQGADATH
jgi:hypothetical protein